MSLHSDYEPSTQLLPPLPSHLTRNRKGVVDFSLLSINSSTLLSVIKQSVNDGTTIQECAISIVENLTNIEDDDEVDESFHPLWFNQQVVEDFITSLSSSSDQNGEELDWKKIIFHITLSHAPFPPSLDYIINLGAKLIAHLPSTAPLLSEVDQSPSGLSNEVFELWWKLDEKRVRERDDPILSRSVTKTVKLMPRTSLDAQEEMSDEEKKEVEIRDLLTKELFNAFVSSEGSFEPLSFLTHLLIQSNKVIHLQTHLLEIGTG